VYAIEASNIAAYCQRLVKENGFADKMTVIMGKVEEVRWGGEEGATESIEKEGRWQRTREE
jgi:hypothetical protein